MPRQITIPAQAEKTRYERITELHYLEDAIAVFIRISDLVDDRLIIDLQQAPKRIYIGGSAYTELMSDSPEWNPDKELNYYNERDLWYIIEQIEQGNFPDSVEIPTNNGILS